MPNNIQKIINDNLNKELSDIINNFIIELINENENLKKQLEIMYRLP